MSFFILSVLLTNSFCCSGSSVHCLATSFVVLSYTVMPIVFPCSFICV